MKKMRVLPDIEQAKQLSAVRVLLVEDDPAFAELVRALLREVRWAELSLEHAATLADGTARLSAERFDLIISDLNLPDSRGLDTVKALVRSSDRLIIVLTGERNEGLRESAITLGAYDLVNKDSLRHAELDRLVRLAWMQSSTFRSLRQSEQDRRAAEVDHRLLFEYAVEGMYRVDASGRVVAANPALATILGYGTAEEMMRGIDDVAREVYVDPAERSRYRKCLAAEGLVSNFETRWRRRDGSVIWVSLSGRLVRDAATGAGFHLGSAKDITERKQAELALRGSEEQLRIAADKLHRFRLALDNSGDIVVLIDREAMRFVDVNSTACRLLGYSREELLAMGPQDVLPVSRGELERAYDALIARAGAVGKMDSHYRCKDGSRLPFESTRHVLRSGGKWLIAAVSRDIRDRLEALDALRGSEERFRSLTQLSSDAYWELDSQYRFVSITGSGDPARLGELRERLVGKSLWEAGYRNPPHEDWAEHRAKLQACESFRDVEVCRVEEGGELRWSSMSGEPFFDAAGRFQGYRGVGKDITARKREEWYVALEHSVARHLSDASLNGEAVQAVMATICRAQNWGCGRFFRLDEAAGVMRLRQTWASEDERMRDFAERSAGLAFRKGEGLIGAVWESGKPLWSADASTDPRVARPALAKAAGVHGAVVFPVVFDSRVTGVISFSGTAVGRPSDRMLSALGLIGAQIGQFLQRKHAEAALAESEGRFRQTFELAATGMAQVGLDRRFLRVNRKLCEILGYSEVELTGRTAKDFSHPDDRDAADAGVERLRRGEQSSFSVEQRYLRKDGSVVWVNLGVALFRDAGGVPQYEIAVYEEITERRQREAALARFRTALDASADMVILVEIGGEARLLDFNDTACYYLGYRREELLGRPATLILEGMTPEAVRASHSSLLGQSGRSDFLVRHYRRKDGSIFEVEVLRRVLDSPDGPILVINARDLTERRRSEERQATHLRLQESTARFGRSALGRREAGELIEDAVQSVREALLGMVVAYIEAVPGERQLVARATAGLPQGHATDIPATYAEHGPAAQALEAGELNIVDAGADGAAALPFEWAQSFKGAAFVPVYAEERVLGALCALGESAGAFGPEESKFLVAAASVLSTGLQRIDSERRLAFLAQFDVLTALPNRALLSDRFSQLIVQARRHGSQLGVLFIDLDDFKLVNDSLGHAGGDELLKEAARRLQAAVRPGDTVARISGDEFAVVLSDLARADDAALVAQKIIDRLSAPVPLLGQEVFITASIGIAAFPADGNDVEALLGAADAAMYRAKQSGRGGYQFFTADINQRTRARAQLGSELRRALERGEFALAYQPKFDLRSGRPCAAEALLRWKSPERGTVPPVEFIPVLEETGLIMPVGEWVLRQACADLKAWAADGLPQIPVAVNLSARQFRQQDLELRIRELVREAGVDPSLIELEITESQLMQDPEHARRTMLALSQTGIRIAIDDFGTGYSSLSYLTRFPLGALKIDRSFVADVLKDQADAAIVRTIIDMAHTLGFIVIAEGVETEAQAALLRSLGCEQAQGYYFARPMPEAELRALMASFDEMPDAQAARASYT